MRNLLDDAPARSIDIIANEDTIEMVLNESAMQALSQAAAPTEPSCPPGPDPVLKEPEVPVGTGQAIAEERRADQLPERPAEHPLERRGDHSGERRANPPERRAESPAGLPLEHRASPPEPRPENSPVYPPERGANSPESRAGNSSVHPSERPPERRPPMSSLRFAILLGVVAVGSAIGTAVTYLATTGALRPGHVATSKFSGAPAAAVAPAAPVTATAPAPVTPAAPAATPAASGPSVQPGPQPASQSLPSALSMAQSTPPSPAADSAPVRFANPFDRKEVFEFPAGTSKADARDAVAELLYERAQDRVVSVRGLVSGMGARHTTSASASATPAGRKAQP